MTPILIGVVVKPQGIKGELKARALLTKEKLIKDINTIYIKNYAYTVQKISIRDGFLYIKLQNCDDVDTAESFRHCELFADEDKLTTLDKGEFYYKDLIGCKIYTPDEQFVGQIVDITNYGSTDILTINNSFTQTLCPFLKDIFISITTDSKKCVIDEKRWKEVTAYEED